MSPAPGSSPIPKVSEARGYAPVTVHAHLGGHGTHRSLRYAIATHPGVTVSFAERSNREYKALGGARGARGTLRFAPGAGAAGTRTVTAIVSEDGVAHRTIVIGHYDASAPALPGRARLRVRRHGRRFTVSFAGEPTAAYYLLIVRASDGRHLLRVIRSAHATLSVAAIGSGDHLQVAVTGVSALGRHGPTRSARA